MRTVNPEQHARKRAEILAAAAREFAVNGVDGTSTASICRRARIGSGTLFHYFRTKQAIFHALFADDLAGNAAACEAALAAERAQDGIVALVNHLIGDLADPLVPGLTAAALLQSQRDAKFAALLAADEQRTLTTLTALLQRTTREGAALAFEPPRVARWIVTMIDATFLAAVEDDFAPAAHAQELHRILAWLTGSARGTEPPA